MSKCSLIRIADVAAFAALAGISVCSFTNRSVAAKIDAFVLPEEINKGFHEVIKQGSGPVEAGEAEGSSFYKYEVLKGALDGEIVTKDDWKVLSNTIKYQMQEDACVMDFRDGTGIVVNKSDYPSGTYGKLEGNEITADGKTIDVSNYTEVQDTVKNGAAPENEKLQEIKDIYAYLKVLNDNKQDYTVFISVNDEGISSLNKKLVELLAKLGVRTNLVEADEDDVYNKIYFRNSYYAVLAKGEPLDEKSSPERLSTSGKLSDGAEYQVESAGYDTGDPKASIIINGTEYAVDQRGLNIVVYDDKSHQITDSVCFDTNYDLRCTR